MIGYSLREISSVKLNESNPRTIKDRKFGQLIGSLLVFPRMLTMRPVVLDEDGTVLGGNMRVRALQQLATLSLDEVLRRLKGTRDYQRLSESERAETVEHWTRWLEHPTIPATVAEGLSDHAKQQFVVKDNASYGDWDWSRLANEWDALELNEWGLDLWGADDTVQQSSSDTDTEGEGETQETASKSKTDVQTKITITLDDPSQYAQILAAIQLAVSDYRCSVK